MCYSLWYNATTMLPVGHRPKPSWIHYTTSYNTQSSAPEDGRVQRPKHVELIGFINKPLLLLVAGSGGIQLPGYRLPATSWVHYTTSYNTQSSASENGRDQRPKHVELIGITNKPLLLHLVGFYIISTYKGFCKTNIIRQFSIPSAS